MTGWCSEGEGDPMSELRDDAFDELRTAIFKTYAAMAKREQEEGPPVGPMNTEHKRRESALCGIDEILEHRPLAMFSALHLKLLELLIAYWREAEVADEAEIKAPEPDLMH
jgi:hypothetical protein